MSSALKKVNGVKSVQADYKHKKVIVDFDDAKTSEKKLKDKIESLGFTVLK